MLQVKLIAFSVLTLNTFKNITIDKAKCTFTLPTKVLLIAAKMDYTKLYKGMVDIFKK